MNNATGKPNDPHQLLDASMRGHKEFLAMTPSSLEGGMLKVVRATELKTRGLRFLPTQVVKRALRKMVRELKRADPPESGFVIAKR